MNSFPKMHVSLYVSNIEKTIQFYDAFFEQVTSEKEEKYAKYMLEEPALIISFIENPTKAQAQFGHLGFQLKTKALLEERLTVIRSKKLQIREKMGVFCCYALQEKFWVSDPDD
ncbi:MAG: VOC family protein [Bacteroidota bacterium]